MTKDIIRLIRPKQWIKNLFVFVPVFFGGALFDYQALFNVAIAFVTFSFAASSIYCFNDLRDVADDRLHPEKCKRPIASGAVSTGQAYAIMATMIVGSLLLTLLLPPPRIVGVITIVSCYFVLNLLYSIKLKQYAIIDVCIVAMGFVLRILAGGMASGIVLSHWIVLMTFLLTLFLSFAKRRDDVVRMQKTGVAPRKNTHRYNLTFINEAINLTGAITIVCYIMYTVSPEVVNRFDTQYLYLTSFFVILGVLRYIQLSVVDNKSGDPTEVALNDRFTQLTILAWTISFFLIIYLS
ncbi:MAG: decaprenyl-phosphate phosphoribosyltransferase [Sodaliphilus pleomorphus]|uniref:decaprenyl-phosphate phosphoribosyltransferase n=1 Tax=Sodaliphilus pleomorphus TaxID=2606626 RepID=UPI002A74A01A|nr:decaprenyl-phosphate phosphoribosyltransferase [Sodaliphilus pleomorphus]MDY2833120.1 decaprenyl-phosphate phosphoribosyltransferase [Sodaliphilus pleomorphus]